MYVQDSLRVLAQAQWIVLIRKLTAQSKYFKELIEYIEKFQNKLLADNGLIEYLKKMHVQEYSLLAKKSEFTTVHDGVEEQVYWSKKAIEERLFELNIEFSELLSKEKEFNEEEWRNQKLAEVKALIKSIREVKYCGASKVEIEFKKPGMNLIGRAAVNPANQAFLQTVVIHENATLIDLLTLVLANVVWDRFPSFDKSKLQSKLDEIKEQWRKVLNRKQRLIDLKREIKKVTVQLRAENIPVEPAGLERLEQTKNVRLLVGQAI